MQKKIYIIIFIIILVIIGTIAYFSYNYYLDREEKVLLQDEVEKVSKYIADDKVDLDKIEEILDPVITTGNRLAVEEALEKYILTSAKAINNTISLLNDENTTNLLSASNYKQDGPIFTNSKAYITKTKAKLLENKEEVLNLTNEENILKYFKNSTNDDYYEKMYRDLAIGNDLNKSDINNFSNSIDTIIKLLDTSSEVINFLSQNSKSWQIENEEIYFTNQELLNTYNNLVAQIK